MIKHSEPLSMAEVKEYLKKSEDSETDVLSFINKFTKLNKKEAQELRKKLEALELMKMKKEHIIKVIDLLPENQENLNKIFADVALDEDETKKILDTVKDFR